MGSLHHLLIEFVGAMAGVNVVVVRACITMVRPRRLVVLKEWSRPNSSCSKRSDIVKRIDDTLDIATKASVDIIFVSLLSHMEAVIALISIHKAVRHDEVDHIGRGKSLALAATFTTGIDGIVYITRFLVFLKGYAVGSFLINSEIYEEIVFALGIVLTCDL